MLFVYVEHRYMASPPDLLSLRDHQFLKKGNPLLDLDHTSNSQVRLPSVPASVLLFYHNASVDAR